MLRCFVIVLVVAGSVRAAPPVLEPHDEAINAGLVYLAANQGADGSWSSRTGKDPAVTSLAVMAFLSAGHVPGEGPYAKNIEAGVRYVLGAQQRNGLLALANQGSMEMYQHGICTLMLCEVVGMMPDRVKARQLRDQLELAVKIVLKAQVRDGEDRGGWRYTLGSTDADVSVSGWQLMALRAAKNVGCDVPYAPVEQAVGYIKRCHDPVSGGYRYQRFGGVTVPCTGTAVLALELIGKEHHQSIESLKAGGYLLKTPLNPRQQHFFYGIYYTSQAMFQLGDNYWSVYRKNLHELLLTQNPPKAAGCWTGWGWDDANVGPSYCTAMAILALTVEYRFLPIYQRDEEPRTK